MTQMPNDYRGFNGPQFGGPPRPPRWRLRRSYIAVFVVVAVCAWVLNHMQPSVTWNDVMDLLDVQDRRRYTEIAVLGLVATAAIAILRVLWSDTDDKN